MPSSSSSQPRTHHRQQRRFVTDDDDAPDAHRNGGGFKVCCCRLCTCINLHVITTQAGVLKIAQIVLGSLCQTLLLRFGQPYAADIGPAYSGCLQTVATSLSVATLLLACYVLSAKTYAAVRQSLFEVLFNAFACFGYLTSASYMAYTVMLWLYPRFLLQPAYMAYPAMTGVYYIATLTGIVHGADAYGALRAYRNARHR